MRRLLCALIGHPWSDWVRVPETMTIVSECRRCPEVRSARYEPMVPESFIDDLLGVLGKPNPYRAFAGGRTRPVVPVEPPTAKSP